MGSLGLSLTGQQRVGVRRRQSSAFNFLSTHSGPTMRWHASRPAATGACAQRRTPSCRPAPSRSRRRTTKVTSCAPAELNLLAFEIATSATSLTTATSVEATAIAAAVSASATKLTSAAASAVASAASSSVEASGILRSAAKQVEYHGKGACDAEGNVPKFAIKDAIDTSKLFDPGTRELILYLAANKRTPSILKANKSTWEGAGRFFWGYMNTDRFTKFAVPDASVAGFSNSKKQHEFVGDCVEREAAEKTGRMRARPMWCSCNACMCGRFDECKMKAQMGGAMRRVTAPLAAGVQVLNLILTMEGEGQGHFGVMLTCMLISIGTYNQPILILLRGAVGHLGAMLTYMLISP